VKFSSAIKGWLSAATYKTASSEQKLAQYFVSRDERSIELLIEQFNQPLFHYLLTMSDRSLAEDILQTTWLKVISYPEHQSPPANIRAWLYTVARNLLIDEFRKSNRWQWQSDENVDLITDSLEEQIQRECQIKTKLALFNYAIERLPFTQKEAFVFQQEGFSLNEICQLTGESFETIKSRLRYAKKNLKHILESNHE
jgi:RNA polymerase sigma-70 factor (ECF subfamily)